MLVHAKCCACTPNCVLQEKAMFERGATDEFLVSSLEPMDEMVSAHVCLENCGMGDSWHLEVRRHSHLHATAG